MLQSPGQMTTLAVASADQVIAWISMQPAEPVCTSAPDDPGRAIRSHQPCPQPAASQRSCSVPAGGARKVRQQGKPAMQAMTSAHSVFSTMLKRGRSRRTRTAFHGAEQGARCVCANNLPTLPNLTGNGSAAERFSCVSYRRQIMLLRAACEPRACLRICDVVARMPHALTPSPRGLPIHCFLHPA